MHFPWVNSWRKVNLRGLKEQVARVHADIDRLEQELKDPSAGSTEGATDLFIRHLRASMARDELASKRAELQELLMQLAELDAELPPEKPSATAEAAGTPLHAVRRVGGVPVELIRLFWRFLAAMRTPVADPDRQAQLAVVAQAAERQAEESRVVPVGTQSGRPASAAQSVGSLPTASGASSGRVRGYGYFFRMLGAGLLALLGIGLLLAIGIWVLAAQRADLGSTVVQVALTIELSAPATRPVQRTGETFLERRLDFQFGGGPVLLSGYPAPDAPFIVDDAVSLRVERPDGTTAEWGRTFNTSCHANDPVAPQMVTGLFQPGLNLITISVYDVCGASVGTPTGLLLAELRR